MIVYIFPRPKGVRVRPAGVAGVAARGVGEGMRTERTAVAVAAAVTAESAEGTVPAVTAFARGVRCHRIEMAANIRVPLQLHDAGRRPEAGRRANVQKLRAPHKHQGLPAAEGREYARII